VGILYNHKVKTDGFLHLSVFVRKKVRTES